MKWRRIHITGAAGAGVSALGTELASAAGLTHFETDDFFWLPTEPPYQQKRPPEDRVRVLSQALRSKKEGWVLSGALEGWGDSLIPEFHLVIFVQTPRDVRLSRLRAREVAKFGEKALRQGGGMNELHRKFMKWAADYDVPTAQTRNFVRHQAWLAELPNPVISVDGTAAINETASRILDACIAGKV